MKPSLRQVQPDQAWKLRRLINGIIGLTNNVAPIVDPQSHIPIRFNPKFNNAVSVFSAVNLNQLSPIEEVVLGRHPNPVVDPKWHAAVSCLVIARAGVANQLIDALYKTQIKYSVLDNFEDDYRARVAFTANCSSLDDCRNLLLLLNVVQVVAPLPKKFFDQVKVLLDPSNVKGEIAQDIAIENEDSACFHDFRVQFWGNIGSYEYNPGQNRIPSKTLPPIFQAIIDHDYPVIDKLLTSNPKLVLQQDPLGRVAMNIVRELGTVEIFRRFYEALQQFPPQSLSDFYDRQTYRYILFRWETLLRNVPPGDYEEMLQEFKKRQDKYLSEFLTGLTEPPPNITELHSACVEGNLPLVTSIISMQPQRIYEQGPFALTPLTFALVNNRLAIVRYLIQQGISLSRFSKKYQSGGRVDLYWPIDSAVYPEGMAIFLYYGIAPESYRFRLIVAIANNDLKMAENLLCYMREMNTYKGLTMLGYAMRMSAYYDSLEMLKLLLSYRYDYVPEGPYDSDLHEPMRKLGLSQPCYFVPNSPYSYKVTAEMATLFEKHNERIDNLRNKRLSKPLFISLETFLATCNMIKGELINGITSELKLLSQLTGSILEEGMIDSKPNEKNEIYRLFFDTFDVLVDPSPHRRLEYLSKALEPCRDKLNCIQLFKQAGKVIAFITFEIIQSSHPTQGEFIIFHAKLAANNNHPDIGHLGLTNLAFRIAFFLQHAEPHKKVFTYFKAIAPGFGLLLLPRNLAYFPKHCLSQELMDHIVKMTSETLEEKTIPAKLVVRDRKPNDEYDPTVRFFKRISGGTPKNAIAVCFQITRAVFDEYQEKLGDDRLSLALLESLTQEWLKFSRNSHHLNALPRQKM